MSEQDEDVISQTSDANDQAITAVDSKADLPTSPDEDDDFGDFTAFESADTFTETAPQPAPQVVEQPLTDMKILLTAATHKLAARIPFNASQHTNIQTLAQLSTAHPSLKTQQMELNKWSGGATPAQARLLSRLGVAASSIQVPPPSVKPSQVVTTVDYSRHDQVTYTGSSGNKQHDEAAAASSTIKTDQEESSSDTTSRGGPSSSYSIGAKKLDSVRELSTYYSAVENVAAQDNNINNNSGSEDSVAGQEQQQQCCNNEDEAQPSSSVMVPPPSVVVPASQPRGFGSTIEEEMEQRQEDTTSVDRFEDIEEEEQVDTENIGQQTSKGGGDGENLEKYDASFPSQFEAVQPIEHVESGDWGDFETFSAPVNAPIEVNGVEKEPVFVHASQSVLPGVGDHLEEEQEECLDNTNGITEEQQPQDDASEKEQIDMAVDDELQLPNGGISTDKAAQQEENFDDDDEFADFEYASPIQTNDGAAVEDAKALKQVDTVEKIVDKLPDLSSLLSNRIERQF